MKRTLLEILACPMCKGKLELNVEAEGGGEIFVGSLYCGKCRISYPITDTIPNLLPPDDTANRDDRIYPARGTPRPRRR